MFAIISNGNWTLRILLKCIDNLRKFKVRKENVKINYDGPIPNLIKINYDKYKNISLSLNIFLKFIPRDIVGSNTKDDHMGFYFLNYLNKHYFKLERVL